MNKPEFAGSFVTKLLFQRLAGRHYQYVQSISKLEAYFSPAGGSINIKPPQHQHMWRTP